MNYNSHSPYMSFNEDELKIIGMALLEMHLKRENGTYHGAQEAYESRMASDIAAKIDSGLIELWDIRKAINEQRRDRQ